MSKHSRSPWTIEEVFKDALFIKSGAETVTIVNAAQEERIDHDDGSYTMKRVEKPRARANAELLRAAPELLERLIRANEALERLANADALPDADLIEILESRALIAKLQVAQPMNEAA